LAKSPPEEPDALVAHVRVCEGPGRQRPGLLGNKIKNEGGHIPIPRSTSAEKPAHGTGEWARHNVNTDSGCPNRCTYCYASAMAIRFGRKTPETWGIPETDMRKVLKRYGRMSGRIMYPTSHDIHPGNLDACVTALKGMLSVGNEVLVVSKPSLGCIRRLCADLGSFKGQVTFRFTIGSADDSVLSAWEPGAPLFSERIACLKYACEAGFMTSVSCEPMLDANIGEVIKATRPYVTDSIWLGRANQLRQIVAINRPGDIKAKELADSLISVMTDDFVRDLYACYRIDPVVKWKESIKKVVGLARPMEKGLDI
jgi:hypothetical protein